MARWYLLVCPICGYSIKEEWAHRRKKPIDIWANVYENAPRTGKFRVIKHLCAKDVKGSEWYVKIKSWVGYWAERFGFADVRVVVREVIPDWVKAKINFLYQRCRGLLRYIRVLEKRYYRLKVKLAGVERQEVEWSNFMFPEYSVEVKEVKKVEEGWR